MKSQSTILRYNYVFPTKCSSQHQVALPLHPNDSQQEDMPTGNQREDGSQREDMPTGNQREDVPTGS